MNRTTDPYVHRAGAPITLPSIDMPVLTGDTIRILRAGAARGQNAIVYAIRDDGMVKAECRGQLLTLAATEFQMVEADRPEPKAVSA